MRKGKKACGVVYAGGSAPASACQVGSRASYNGERWRLTAINDQYAMLRDESQLDRLIFVSPDTLLEDVEPYQVRHLSDGKGTET